MPKYDFRCEKCGHLFERTQKMADPNPPCPQNVPESATKADPPVVGHFDDHLTEFTCGGTTKKLISGGTFHLRGKGWASDGYS